jgi:phosphoglucomutase
MPAFIFPAHRLNPSLQLHQLLSNLPDPGAITLAAKSLILSAAGWRKVFSSSGDEEDSSALVLPQDLILAAVMADTFCTYLADRCHKAPEKLHIAIGSDSRPTGPNLALSMIATCLSLGCTVDYTGVSAAPELFAYPRNSPGLDGFIYISASHNPVGHNGVKFGDASGGVFDGEQAKVLIELFLAKLSSETYLADQGPRLLALPRQQLSAVYDQADACKARALQNYEQFSIEVSSNNADPQAQAAFCQELSTGLAHYPLGVLAELNGSARGVSIDQAFFSKLGMDVTVLNGQPGQIVHRIVPEGHSLNLCRDELTRLYSHNRHYQLGYVPDNDGDRGNVVYIDPSTGQAKIIEAQDVFALAVMAELCHMVYTGVLSYSASGLLEQKAAIAINCPNSLRIEELASYFQVEVHRAEVGEANVVNLGEELRRRGYLVRIVGEGSNGGNICYPAKVRDPLHTIVGLAKLLCLRGTSERPGLYQIYCQLAGLSYNPDFNLATIMAHMPAYTTTSVYEARALYPITTKDHGLLKSRYEAVFLNQWPQYRDELKAKLGVTSYEVINTEGIKEIRGMGPKYRSGSQRGGFKIQFLNHQQQAQAFIWMRGSGTEPVFRVLVDVKGLRPDLEAWLLDWHCQMLALADKQS